MTPMPQSPVDIGNVQAVRKAVLLGAIVLLVLTFVFVASRWPEGHFVHECLEWTGVALIIVCIVGRTWCSLYIGGRKNAEVVAEGPYSITRNPLYVFSILGAAGVGAQLGAFSLALLAATIVWFVFHVVVGQEERHLRSRMGVAYEHYLLRVPRFLPRLSLWHSTDSLHVRPTIVVRTFVDACFFLLAIPAAEFFEWTQQSGLIPVLLWVP